MDKILFRHVRSVRAEFMAAAKQSPAIYFAPLVGAVEGVKGCWKRFTSR